MTEPRKALKQAGAETWIVSPAGERVRAWDFKDWSGDYRADQPLGTARAEDFDALLLPGGVINPDKLRTQQKAIAFVKAFIDAGKPVAAICHGPSWPSLKTDLTNAGASWVDEEVVADGALVTSRRPGDIPAFNAKIIEVFAESRRARAAAGGRGKEAGDRTSLYGLAPPGASCGCPSAEAELPQLMSR